MSSKEDFVKIKKSELEEIIERKVGERLQQKLDEKDSNGSDIEIKNTGPQNKNSGISRRKFLKKLGMGAAGLGALSLTPAAARMRITSDSIEHSGTNILDFSTGFGINKNLNMDGKNIQNVGSLNVDTLNSADIANASADTVLTAQGDGTLSMGVVETDVDGDSISPSDVDTGTLTVDSNRIYVQSSEPSGPAQGDVWIDNSEAFN